MDKMKREDIDNMIMEGFEKIDGEKILPQFSDNLNTLLSILEKNRINPNDHDAFYTVSCLSCIMTAQTNAINIVREVLYKIFCENEETTKHTTTGGNENVLNQ